LNDQEIKKISLELLGSADAAYVTTIDQESHPQTRCMFNLRNRQKFPKLIEMFDEHKDDFMILLTTNTSSEKIAHIRKNPVACIYYCQPEKFHGLMLSGNIEIIDDHKLREKIWHEGWERYYATGPNDPDHTVLRFLPIKAKGWYGGCAFEFSFKAVS